MCIEPCSGQCTSSARHNGPTRNGDNQNGAKSKRQQVKTAITKIATIKKGDKPNGGN